MSEEFQHISVGLNQMLTTLRRKMDENKAREQKAKPIRRLEPTASQEPQG